MRRLLVSLSSVSLLALASCGDPGLGTKAAPEMTPKQHLASAESTVTRMSVALAAGDTTALRQLAGDHFALVEDGHAYSTDGMVAAVSAALAGAHMQRTLGEMHTHLHGRVAWTHYPVTVTLEAGKGTETFARIETAVLERNDDESWSIVLMSSMAAEKK